MSTTATDAPAVRQIGAGIEGDAMDRLTKRRVEEADQPRSSPGGGATETADVAVTSTSAQSDGGTLTFDQRMAIRRSLEDLAALETDRVERVAAVGLEPVAAYDLGIRYAVHDALAKLSNGTYGGCETCRSPIPAARLEAVPYARRCVTCQEREEKGWDQVGRLVGGVVRRLAGEPQGRSEMGSWVGGT